MASRTLSNERNSQAKTPRRGGLSFQGANIDYYFNVRTIKLVEITFDQAKNEKNILDRGLSFDQTRDFDFLTASIVVDTRYDYGEVRFRALGWLDGRLHVLVFARYTKGIRIISFRKANKREARQYEQETKS